MQLERDQRPDMQLLLSATEYMRVARFVGGGLAGEGGARRAGRPALERVAATAVARGVDVRL